LRSHEPRVKFTPVSVKLIVTIVVQEDKPIVNKLAAIIIACLAVLLVSCGLAGGDQSSAEIATYTPLPTYTALPTYTPFPTATATFLPSPTPLPEESPTPTEGAETPEPTASFDNQGVLQFSSNLREGPGLEFDDIIRLAAGEQFLIIGRDLPGNWLFGRAASGQEGWVRLTQFEGPIQIARIPLAQDIPTPEVTFTPSDEDEDDEEEEEEESGPTPTPIAAEAPPGSLQFVITAGAVPVCETFTWEMPQTFNVDNTDGPIPPFDFDNTATTVGVIAYQLSRSAVPDFITLSLDGDVLPGDCDDSSDLCKLVTMTMCVSAPAHAPTGGSDYVQNVLFSIGTQSYDQYFQETQASIPTVFRVVAP
jgi:hypothetical protein